MFLTLRFYCICVNFLFYIVDIIMNIFVHFSTFFVTTNISEIQTPSFPKGFVTLTFYCICVKFLFYIVAYQYSYIFPCSKIWLSWQNSELALDEVKSFFSLYYEDTLCDDVVMSQLKKSCQSLFCSIFLIIFYTLHTHIHTMDCKMEPDTYT